MAPNENNTLKCSKCFVEFKQNESVIKCGGICETILHKQCTNLNRSGCKSLTENESLKWFCEVCNKASSMLMAMLQKLGSKIDKVEETVSKHTSYISSLSTKIDQLTNEEKIGEKSGKHVKIPLQSQKIKAPSREPLAKYSGAKGVHDSLKEETTEVQLSKGKQPLEVIANQNHDKGNSSRDLDNNFTVVAHRKRKQKQQFIEGSGDITSNKIRAIEKNAWIYVTRLDKDTTAEQIADHLASVCRVECAKLEGGNSDRVASFRIRAPFEKKDQIMSSDLWPKGTLLNRYYFPRYKSSQRRNGTMGEGAIGHSAGFFLERTVAEASSR